MDLTGIQTLIQAAGYGTDTQSTAAQTAAIAATFLELAGEREWSWLRKQGTGNLVVGSENLTEPTRLVIPTALRLSRGTASSSAHYTPLNKIDGATLREWLYQDQGTDLPSEWAWIDRQVVVYPRPDYAYDYQLDYIEYPDVTVFDAGGESPPFEARFHPVIAWGSIRWLATRQRDAQTYALANAEYEQAKRRFKHADRANNEQTHVASWDGWSILDT